jgi:hypothetical protein
VNTKQIAVLVRCRGSRIVLTIMLVYWRTLAVGKQWRKSLRNSTSSNRPLLLSSFIRVVRWQTTFSWSSAQKHMSSRNWAEGEVCGPLFQNLLPPRGSIAPPEDRKGLTALYKPSDATKHYHRYMEICWATISFWLTGDSQILAGWLEMLS